MLFGIGGLGFGARGWAGTNVPVPTPTPPEPLAIQSQQVPVIIVAEKLLPIVQSQSFPLDIVAYKNTLTPPQLRLEVSGAAITLGGTLRLTGTGPAITLTGTLLFASACPGLVVEILTGGALNVGTYRVSYNGGSTWALAGSGGQVLPAGGTQALNGAATGVTLNFAAGTYVVAAVYQGTVATIRSTEGSTYTFANATVTLQPVFRHASDPANPEARAGLYFGGAQYLTSLDAAVIALFTNDPALTVVYRVAYALADANGTVVAACSSAGSNDKRRYGQINTGTGREQQAWVNAANAANASHVSSTDPLTGTNTPHNVCWYGPGSGGAINLETNGGSAQTVVPSTATIGTLTPNRVSIGAVHDNSADTFLTGHIYDLAVFSAQLGGTDRGSWNTEMAA
jgi:hypothetical protein